MCKSFWPGSLNNFQFPLKLSSVWPSNSFDIINSKFTFILDSINKILIAKRKKKKKKKKKTLESKK